MTKFEEDLNRRMDLKEVPMYFTQSGCSMTRKTYIETSWLFDTYKNWRSDEAFQKMVELGGSYVLANKNLIDENKRLAQEIVDLKSQLEHQDILIVPSFVAEWYEEHKGDLDYAIYSLCEESDDTELNREPTEFESWFYIGSNQPILTLARMKDGYKIEEEQKFYLKNKLTDMYLYKKTLGGYGEESASSIKNLTDDFKFTQKEIDGMDAQSYDKKR